MTELFLEFIAMKELNYPMVTGSNKIDFLFSLHAVI